MSTLEVKFEVTEGGRKSPQYTIDSDLSGEVTLAEFLQFTKANLIIIADATLKEEQLNGFDKKPVVAVDGRVGKPVINVNPLGQIEFSSRLDIKEIVQFTMQSILDRSPVDTGRYKEGHRVFLNGKEVARDMASLTAWLQSNPQIKGDDIIRFVNIEPYARRLERLGVTAGKGNFRSVSRRFDKSRDKKQRSGPLILAPNGTYFLTSRAVKRKFKRNSSVRFSFLPGSAMGLTATFKTYSKASRTRKTSRSKKSTYLYPTITILVNEAGIV